MAKNKVPQDKNERDYAKYIGKEVSLVFSAIAIEGVLGRPNFEEGTIEVLPHIDYDLDQEHLYLEDKVPVTIPLGKLNRESTSRPIYMPHKNGYLENKVRITNKTVDRKKGIGFTTD